MGRLSVSSSWFYNSQNRIYHIPCKKCRRNGALFHRWNAKRSTASRTFHAAKTGKYEMKFDGYRCIAIKQRGEVQLFSRNGSLFTHFPNVNAALREQQAKKTFLLDGEIVAQDETGKSAFNALQRARTRQTEVHYYVFDVLNLERQRILREEFASKGFVHITGALDADWTL